MALLSSLRLRCSADISIISCRMLLFSWTFSPGLRTLPLFRTATPSEP
jgi:hypothetical protein